MNDWKNYLENLTFNNVKVKGVEESRNPVTNEPIYHIAFSAHGIIGTIRFQIVPEKLTTVD